MENKQPSTLRELLIQLNSQGVTDYRRYEAVRTFLGFKARRWKRCGLPGGRRAAGYTAFPAAPPYPA